MYTRKSIFFAAALMLLAACQAEIQEAIPEEINETEEMVVAPAITAVQEPQTKTILEVDGEGVGTIYWKPADEINVFYGTTSTHYVSQNDANATTAVFTTTDIIGIGEGAATNIWGLYPYNSSATCTGSAVTTTLPATQYGVPGTFDDDLFITLAHNNSTALTFYNVCGGIKFSLSRDDITSITFRGNNNEDIAGDISLAFSDGLPTVSVTSGVKEITLTPKAGGTFDSGEYYYLILLPCVLSNGFTMTFTDNDGITGVFDYQDKAVAIKRSIFSKKSDIDTFATFELCNKIYYTTSNEQTVSIVFSSAFNATVVSNTYEEGIGCITFDQDVTMIGSGAFYQCATLTSITIPKKVSSITGSAFNQCTSLSSFSGKYSSANGKYLRSGNTFIALASAGYTSYTVPSDITVLGEGAFHGCVNLTSITLPSGLTSIGNVCFGGCSTLTTLVIPASVTEIGYGAFSGCSKLSSVNIPSGVQEIKHGTFRSCDFSSIVIPNSVTAIDYEAFYGCRKLTSITIPGSVKSIDHEAFNGCKLLSSLTIEYGVESLGESVFYGCSSLGSVSIPSSVTTIGPGAFSNCSNLTNINIPAGITTINSGVFRSCTSLPSITLPSSVTRIEQSAFWNCTTLANITLPTQLTYIGDSSFKYCSSLSEIEIPSNVAAIADSAFEGASSLSGIVLTRSTPPSLGWKAFDNTNNCPIYVPSQSIDTYKKASYYWKGYADRIQAIP